MRDYPVRTCFCLRCGHNFDRASNLTGGGQPKPGDITLCIECGHILQFDKDMAVQLVDEATALGTMSPTQRTAVLRAKVAIALAAPLFAHHKETKH